MTMHIDRGIRKNCWNLIDSYGEICVGCRCCSPDKKVRYPARLRCLQEWLEERLTFKHWSDDPYWLEVQKKNVAADIKLFRRRIKYYKRKLKEMEANVVL